MPSREKVSRPVVAFPMLCDAGSQLITGANSMRRVRAVTMAAMAAGMVNLVSGPIRVIAGRR